MYSGVMEVRGLGKLSSRILVLSRPYCIRNAKWYRSLVIDELSKSLISQEDGLAYMYLDYADRDSQSPEKIFRTVVKQLALHRTGHCEAELEQPYQECRRKGNSEPSREGLVHTLHLISQHFKQTYILIDALDEASDQTRQYLMKTLSSHSLSHCKFFLTSRPHLTNVPQRFFNCLEVKITAHDEDVVRMVQSRMKHEQAFFDIYEDDDSEINAVARKITAKAGDMYLFRKILSQCIDRLILSCRFLHAELMVNSMSTCISHKEVAATLEQTPSDLAGLYERTLERIKAQDEKRAQISYRAIWWLSRAKRPLSLQALQQALVVRRGDTASEPQSYPPPGIIKSACMGLINIDKYFHKHSVRFAHHTAQIYLRDHLSQSRIEEFVMEKDIISSTCLTLLSFEDVKIPALGLSDQTNLPLLHLLTRNPLLSYAACYWPCHLSPERLLISSNLSSISSRTMKKPR